MFGSPCCSRWAGFAVQPNRVTGLATRRGGCSQLRQICNLTQNIIRICNLVVADVRYHSVVLVGLDLQFAIIMYWNDTAWMAIKSTHPRYSLDDGKTQHTRLQWL